MCPEGSQKHSRSAVQPTICGRAGAIRSFICDRPASRQIFTCARCRINMHYEIRSRCLRCCVKSNEEIACMTRVPSADRQFHATWSEYARAPYCPIRRLGRALLCLTLHLFRATCRHPLRGVRQERMDVSQPLSHPGAGAACPHAPEWSRWLRETLRAQTCSNPQPHRPSETRAESIRSADS